MLKTEGLTPRWRGLPLDASWCADSSYPKPADKSPAVLSVSLAKLLHPLCRGNQDALVSWHGLSRSAVCPWRLEGCQEQLAWKCLPCELMDQEHCPASSMLTFWLSCCGSMTQRGTQAGVSWWPLGVELVQKIWEVRWWDMLRWISRHWIHEWILWVQLRLPLEVWWRWIQTIRLLPVISWLWLCWLSTVVTGRHQRWPEPAIWWIIFIHLNSNGERAGWYTLLSHTLFPSWRFTKIEAWLIQLN